MRRSSRIQIKQEGSAADSKSELSKPNRTIPRVSRLPARTIKVLSPKNKIGQRNSLQQSKPLNQRKQTKSSNKSQNKNGGNLVKTSTQSNPMPCHSGTAITKNAAENTQKRNPDTPQVKSKDKATSSGKTVKNELSIPLLIQDDSNDSILSDVANSLKIDRTIKNLSPRKFFHNKDPKTTRSGRNFSPYDFASYSALFGSICANQTNKTKPESKAEASLRRDAVKREGMQSKLIKQKKARRDKKESVRSAKKPKKPNTKYTKRVIVPPVEFEEINDVGSSPVRVKEELLPTEKPHHKNKKNSEEFEDDILSEKVPASFWLDFPFTRCPVAEGHSLPAGFWGSDFGGSIPFTDWEVEKKWFEPKMPDPGEMAALSKVSLADTDKYEFKSVFKDVSSQVANFEESCGEWKPSPAYGKFDVMEAESAEGRRFYRKRITDTRLIAWHKYNLVSSTRYCPEADVPTTRPVIKVRSNQCHKADLVWRLNQTQPPPSIEDVLNGPVIPHPDPKHNKK